MGLTAVFDIENDQLNLAVNLLLLFLVVFWMALVYWTYADARRRIDDPMLVGCATAASLFPFMGTIVYLIVRPPEFIEDRRERDLEIAAAEARLASIEQLACPHCGYEVERAFLRCPSCLNRLKEPCATCGKPLDPRWRICPYCEAEVGAPAAQPARRERQRPRRERPAAAAEAPARADPASAQRAPGERPQRTARPRPAEGQARAARPADGSSPAQQRKARPAEGAERPAAREASRERPR